MAAAAAAVIAFATRAGLAARRDLVSVLHLAGAEDSFIAGLFQARFARMAAIAGALGAATAFGITFVLRQRTLAVPLLPLDMFAVRRFSLAAATSLGSFVSQGLAFVALPFLLQGPLHYTPFQSGLLITPWPLALALIATPAGRLADRFPPAILCTAGLALYAVGLATLARLPAGAGAFDVMWRCGLCGVGFGFFQSPNNRELLGSVPRTRSGGASGVLATARVTGQALGAAITAIVLASATAQLPALEKAATTALWLAALAAVVATAASATRLAASD